MYKRGQNVYRVRSQICLWHGRGTSCCGRDCKFLLRPCRRTAAQDSAERWNYFTLFHNASVSRSTNVQMLSGAALPAGLHWTVGAEGWGWARHMALSTGECECGLASILHHSCAVLENAEAWGGWNWRSQVPLFFSGQSPWSCTWTEVLQKQPYHHRQWHHDSGKAKTERHRQKWHEMANICKYKYVSLNIIELQVCAVICHVFKDVATRILVLFSIIYLSMISCRSTCWQPGDGPSWCSNDGLGANAFVGLVVWDLHKRYWAGYMFCIVLPGATSKPFP